MNIVGDGADVGEISFCVLAHPNGDVYLINRWYMEMVFCSRGEKLGAICFTGRFIYWNRQKLMGDEA